MGSTAQYLGVFILALCLRVWFCFFDSHYNAYGLFDAGGYFGAASALAHIGDYDQSWLEHFFAVITGRLSQTDAAMFQLHMQPLRTLLVSGPAFPLFLLSSYALLGIPFDPQKWIYPISAQCLISALTCLVIMRTGEIVWSKRVGLAAGVLAALYPAFVINCGRGTTETFATFLLASIAWLTCQLLLSGAKLPARIYLWLAALIGLLSAVLCQTRSVMVLVGFFLIPASFPFLPRRARLRAATFYFLAIVVVFLLWLLFQKGFLGHATLLVDRDGKQNFGIGNDLEWQGWTSMPFIYQPTWAESFARQLLHVLKDNPIKWLWLCQTKLPRLLEFPWNDFRNSLGFVSVPAQITCHQILLVFSAIGSVFLFADVGQNWNQKRALCVARLLILFLAAVHFVYLPFITVERYNLSAMPFFLLVASSFFFYAAEMRRKRKSHALPMVLAAALVLFVIVKIPLFSICLSALGAQSTAFALAVAILARTSVFACLVVALWKAADSSKVNNLAARAIVCLLSILCFAPLCLPVRVHGAWWDKTTALKEPIHTRLVVPAESVSLLRSSQVYLMVDAEGQAQAANGMSFKIGDAELSGPLVPLISLYDDPDRLEHNGNNAYHIGESIFRGFADATDASPLDLRQWFLIPLSKEESKALATRPGAESVVEITVAPEGNVETQVFGCWEQRGPLAIPSWTIASWDKAYYGVESDKHPCDPRVDGQLLVDPRDTRMNLRLLVVRTGKIEGAPPLEPLSQNFVPDCVLTSEGPVREKKVEISPLPAYSPQDNWLIEIRGKYRCAAGHKRIGVELVAESGSQRYSSGWAPRRLLAEPDWREFHLGLPLKPGSLSAGTLKLALVESADSPILTAFTHNPDEGKNNQVEFAKTSVRIFRWPVVPNYNNCVVY